MLLEKTINSNKYVFFCETWETSNSWGHKCILHKNGNEINSAKVRYYNRTWEAYTYQSVLKLCVYNLIESKKEYIINTYKTENNIKRLSKDKKNELIGNNSDIKELNKLLNTL